jgi:hypothetical protein
MTAVVVVALVIVAVIVAAGLVVLVLVTRDAYRTRDQWAEEDRAAGADLRRGLADKDFWAGPAGF